MHKSIIYKNSVENGKSGKKVRTEFPIISSVNSDFDSLLECAVLTDLPQPATVFL